MKDLNWGHRDLVKMFLPIQSSNKLFFNPVWNTPSTGDYRKFPPHNHYKNMAQVCARQRELVAGNQKNMLGTVAPAGIPSGAARCQFVHFNSSRSSLSVTGLTPIGGIGEAQRRFAPFFLFFKSRGFFFKACPELAGIA